MKVCAFLVVCLLHVLQSEGQPLVEAPARVPATVLTGSAPGSCPSEQDTIDAQNMLRQNISTILDDLPVADIPTTELPTTELPTTELPTTKLPTTELPTTELPTTEEPVAECGGTGWRRVGYLDMTDPSQSCPSGLALKYYHPTLRTCGRSVNAQYNNDTAGCWSTFYATGGSQYSQVCGRVRGYQWGHTDAFRSGTGASIDSIYLNGVSLTHGPSGNRTHIWSFVAGHSKLYDPDSNDGPFRFCHCADPNTIPPPPPYAANEYFCDSGFTGHSPANTLYPDPLWDGQNCDISSCCQFNNPPYFTKILPTPTSDSIELRVCVSYETFWVDAPIDQVELYVV